ncbi:hypothetical protein SF123566_8102 [Shigella flexneri 1235-66]|nr:hypothetical protein SF123566_8102 [Shigella flexneri 1235-66]
MVLILVIASPPIFRMALCVYEKGQASRAGFINKARSE